MINLENLQIWNYSLNFSSFCILYSAQNDDKYRKIAYW